jgi:predicted dehydrogenase
VVGHATATATEIYTRGDPTQKLDAMESIVPPHLRRGAFQPSDRLIALLKRPSYGNLMFPVSRENSYRILGPEGSLEFPDLHLWRYRVDSEAGWTRPVSRERSAVQADAYCRDLQQFCRVIYGDVEPLVSGEDGSRSLQVTAAILQAASMGQPVDPSQMTEVQGEGGVSGTGCPLQEWERAALISAPDG